jgi:hypothetical protein
VPPAKRQAILSINIINFFTRPSSLGVIMQKKGLVFHAIALSSLVAEAGIPNV